MRMTLTVVDPVRAAKADVVLAAEGQTPIPQIAALLGRLVGSAGPEQPALFVGGESVDPRHTFASSPLFEGVVVSLHDPSGCLPAEPSGAFEVRVVGGAGGRSRAPARSGQRRRRAVGGYAYPAG